MNGVIVLFAVAAMLVIAMGAIGALKRRALNNNAACGSAKDEGVLLI